MNNQNHSNFPEPDVQGNQSLKKSPRFIWPDPNWKIIASFILIVLVCWIGWIIINGLSELGGGFGSTVMDWFKDPTIIPRDKKGFTSFLRIVLTAAFIGILLILSKRK